MIYETPHEFITGFREKLDEFAQDAPEGDAKLAVSTFKKIAGCLEDMINTQQSHNLDVLSIVIAGAVLLCLESENSYNRLKNFVGEEAQRTLMEKFFDEQERGEVM